MLFAFVKEQRNNKDNDNLYVTYFIAGLSHFVNGIKSIKCMVIPEENLEAFKSTLSMVTSTHIYSVSKSKIKDDNVLYTADYDSVKENICDSNKYSAIKYPKAKIRSEADMKSLQSSLMQKTETTEPTQLNGNTKQNGVNEHVSQKPSEKTKKKTDIAGMFANQTKKTESKSKEKVPEKTTKDEQKEVEKEDKKNSKESSSNKKGGMMSFFSKQTGKPSDKTEPVKKEETTKPSTVKKEASPSPPKRQAAGKGKGKRTKSGHDSDDDNQKKRKRIIATIIDSSSEEEMEYESPIPSPIREPSPLPESPKPKEVKTDSPKKESPEKVTYNETGEKKRRRRRKLVPKTFMDNEGYMVTEKVWESESTDASDVEPPAKKQQPVKQQSPPQKKKASPKKKSPPSAGSRKQPALTSFFKKK